MSGATKRQSRRHLGARGRGSTWLAWSLAALAVALLAGGAALSLAGGSSGQGSPPGGETGDINVVSNLLTLLTFAAVGAVIASRHPRNPIGWLFCGVGVVMGLNAFAGDSAEFLLAGGLAPRGLGETAAWFSSWLWVLLVFVPASSLLLLFPDGRLPSPRWRPVAFGVILGTASGVAGYALQAGPLADFPQIANPYGVQSPIVRVAGVSGSILAAGSMLASAASLLVRLRTATPAQRQQIKWLAYGGVVVVSGVCLGGLIIPWSVPVSITVMSASLLGLPTFTGIAIVRYRLYDIDLLINRTLVYASLTAALVLVYLVVVTVARGVLGLLTGQPEQPQIVVVATTLLVAALFNPLRRRIQQLIDRRFYRTKYDAAEALDRLGARLRDETDLGSLGAEVVGVVRETVQPEHVLVWLRPGGAKEDARLGPVVPASAPPPSLAYRGAGTHPRGTATAAEPPDGQDLVS